MAHCVRPGTPSDQAVLSCLSHMLAVCYISIEQPTLIILNPMEVHCRIERKIIIHVNLSSIFSKEKTTQCKMALTVTSSPSLRINGGPGNWPLTNIISRVFPFGDPDSQLKSNVYSTHALCAQWIIYTRIKGNT